jgi:3-methyladenine DNA glycosylase AlkC
MVSREVADTRCPWSRTIDDLLTVFQKATKSCIIDIMPRLNKTQNINQLVTTNFEKIVEFVDNLPDVHKTERQWCAAAHSTNTESAEWRGQFLFCFLLS